MKWYEIIGLIGSVVSVIAATYTVRYSTIVKNTRNELLGLLKLSKFTGINEATISVLSQIKKIANRPTIARGTNIQEIIESLNVYYEKIFRLRTEKEVENNATLMSMIDNYRAKVDAISATDRTNASGLISLFNEVYQLTLVIDNEFNKFSTKIVEKR